MAVRHHETESEGLHIEVEDFVFDCLDYKLPQLLPELRRTEHMKIALCLHDTIMQESEREGKASLIQDLEAHDIRLEPAMIDKLCTCVYNIEGAIMGMGIDMLEPDAPQRVLWEV